MGKVGCGCRFEHTGWLIEIVEGFNIRYPEEKKLAVTYSTAFEACKSQMKLY